MQPGFTNLPCEAFTFDGENWTLLKPLEFLRPTGRLVRAMVGSITDGPSIPPAAQGITRKFGPAWVCGALHDAAYRDTLEVQTMSGEWVRCDMSRDEADDLILEAMEAQGVPQVERELIYEAVHVLGLKAFKQDRATADSVPGPSSRQSTATSPAPSQSC